MTGAPVWKVLNDTQAYVSPMLVELAGRRQIVVVSSMRVVGLAPENGALLWSYPWDTDMGINVSQPISSIAIVSLFRPVTAKGRRWLK